MPELKVTEQHLKHDAYLYIRQSTPRQVMENTESTQRQYALRDRAMALGWPLERIHVLDCDLGKSGSQSGGRDGFQKLVSEVALGKAGLVMGLEVSRLARNSADWHRLIELCSLMGALILDEDGIYDPANFNDRLLLGLNRPETQSTPCSTSRRPFRTVFRLRSRTPLAWRQSIPPADVSHVLRGEPPTKGAAQPRAVQTSRDVLVTAPWRHFVNLGNRRFRSL
jgi:hypothetical protein